MLQILIDMKFLCGNGNKIMKSKFEIKICHQYSPRFNVK